MGQDVESSGQVGEVVADSTPRTGASAAGAVAEVRPDWTYPDADLLAECHEARREIEAALARRAR